MYLPQIVTNTECMNENIITLLNYVVTYIYSESVGKHLGTYINKIKSVRLPRMGVMYKKV